MDRDELLTRAFEANRGRLRAVAYRMLGSLAEADDAVQETWIRLNRTDSHEIDNLGGWLTTVVSRVCLNVLRSRRTRREDLSEHLPDPIVVLDDEAAPHPETQTVVADAVGVALLVVLDTLTPAERLAFVLHDMFAVPFEEIAPMVDRTPAAARQLASRARRRVRGAAVTPDPDIGRQRQVVRAFFAAARAGDFDALLEVLDPDVVVRSDRGTFQGAAAVARGATTYGDASRVVHPALVNGAAGALITADGRPFSVMAFTIVGGRIVAIDAVNDRERLARIDLPEVTP
jgi:RNA polymerase sigma factor (sigma-70 family)